MTDNATRRAPFQGGRSAPHEPPRPPGAHAAPQRDLRAAALAYAEMGWPVFPLLPRDKVPLIPKSAGGRGVHDATTDPDRVAAWWERAPSANVGLACGVASWVLDVDGPAGIASARYLIGRFGPLPLTPRSRTGSGGWHLFFAADKRVTNATGVLPGLDTRSRGGYVVAPPSVHPCGDRYRWAADPAGVPVAEAPAWLVALVEPLEPEPAPEAPRPSVAGNVTSYAVAALASACGRVEAAHPGVQCETLDHEGYGIGRLVAGGVVGRGEALAALVAAGCRMRCQAGRRPWTAGGVRWRVERAFGQAARAPRAPENGHG